MERLSNRNTEELLNGVRKDVQEGKENPLDFSLWKSAKEGEIYWESPWGKGRPGWHIECSAMAFDTLGESIDIHGGGKDLIFPHHENEIAQSEAYTGKTFAKYWIHNGLITINGQKMSKSLGNSMTIKQALEKYNPEVIRYAMLEKHYSTDIDLSDKVFALSEKHLYYFYNTLAKIQSFIDTYGSDGIGEVIDVYIIEDVEKNFIASMDDDFNTSMAISQMFGICKYANTLMTVKSHSKADISVTLSKLKEKIIKEFSIVGLFQETPEIFIKELRDKHLNILGITSSYIEDLIAQRNSAKADKNYDMADKLRSTALEHGIILNDGKDGTSWDVKELYDIEK